jgi:hypothetical protein
VISPAARGATHDIRIDAGRGVVVKRFRSRVDRAGDADLQHYQRALRQYAKDLMA